MDTPTRYDNICQKALQIKEELNLTDTQTLLYNHICRGDFKLRNEDGQSFYHEDNNGFGWSGDRKWVKAQLKKLIDNNLVKFQSVNDCRDSRYSSWYFFSPEHDINDLVDAGCYVTTSKLAEIKNHFNLPDGFDKNQTYGDVQFIKHKKKGYTFKYKGEDSIYSWDHNGKGIKQDLTWLNGKPTWDKPLWYETFDELLHDLYSFIVHDGYKPLRRINGYTDKRQFTI